MIHLGMTSDNRAISRQMLCKSGQRTLNLLALNYLSLLASCVQTKRRKHSCCGWNSHIIDTSWLTTQALCDR